MSRDRVLRRVSALRERARQAVFAYDFATARAKLRTALSLLDGEPGGDMDVVSARVLALVSLAYAESAGAPVSVGLQHLDAANDLLDQVADGPRRSELSGHILQQRGVIMARAGHDEEALRFWALAAERLRIGLDAGVGDPYVLASLHLNRSLGFLQIGDIPAARRELDECFRMCERHDLRDIEIKAIHNLGYIEFLVGDIPAALRHYAATVRSAAASSPGLLALAQIDRGRALLAAGLPDDAAIDFTGAASQFGQRRAQQDMAEAEVGLAAARLLGGNLLDARRLAQSAERRFARLDNLRWGAIAALTALRAGAGRALGKGRVPTVLVARAVSLAEELRTLMLEDESALALLLAVRLELRRGDRAAARSLLESIPAPRVTTPVDHQMLLRLCRAELAVADGDERRALAEARAGMVFLGSARDRMGGLELVCGTAIHGQELGEFAIKLVLGRARASARTLFDWLERTRAQVYRYEPLPTIDDPEMADKASELRRLRRAVQLDRLAGRSAQKQAKQAAAVQRDVLRQGWHASPWGRPRPVVRAPEVMDALHDRVLVSFAASQGRLVAVVLTKGRARLFRLGAFADAAEWAARLHADLDVLAPDTLPAPIVDVVKASAARSAAALDEQLLRPLRTLLADRPVVVVPTGALYAVPWGSLPSFHGRPVVVAPSATAWLAAETSDRAPGRTVLARGPMLTGLVAEEGPLRSIYPDAVVFDEDRANVTDVLAALDGADLAHLAAHGEHEPTNALFSRLELADGPLFAYELARLRQPPRQVVLAACELALNYVRPGDEALGYAGALLASGVRTVVAAVSRVGDESAASAMVDYHRALSGGVAPAEALADAIAVDPYRRPFICLGAG